MLIIYDLTATFTEGTNSYQVVLVLLHCNNEHLGALFGIPLSMFVLLRGNIAFWLCCLGPVGPLHSNFLEARHDAAVG